MSVFGYHGITKRKKCKSTYSSPVTFFTKFYYVKRRCRRRVKIHDWQKVQQLSSNIRSLQLWLCGWVWSKKISPNRICFTLWKYISVELGVNNNNTEYFSPVGLTFFYMILLWKFMWNINFFRPRQKATAVYSRTWTTVGTFYYFPKSRYVNCL